MIATSTTTKNSCSMEYMTMGTYHVENDISTTTKEKAEEVDAECGCVKFLKSNKDWTQNQIIFKIVGG